MKTSRNTIYYLGFISLCALGLFIGNRQDKLLKRNNSNTVGEILNVKTSSKSPEVFVDFGFKINGKQFYNSSSIQCPKSDCFQFLYSLLINKKLKVVYQKNNPENAEMLFRGQDYNKFGITLDEIQSNVVKRIDSLINSVE